MGEVALTAPVKICLARAAIHNLQHDRRGVADFIGRVVGTVIIGAHELEALATREVVVPQAGKHGPELSVVVAVGCRDVASERDVGWVGAQIGVHGTESRALRGQADIPDISARADAVQAKPARTSVSLSEMGGSLLGSRGQIRFRSGQKVGRNTHAVMPAHVGPDRGDIGEDGSGAAVWVGAFEGGVGRLRVG
jgi:hypothetical protein